MRVAGLKRTRNILTTEDTEVFSASSASSAVQLRRNRRSEEIMSRQKAGRIAAIVLSLFAPAALAQRGPSAKPAALTAMDYIEIRQLVNRYAFALDTGGNNGYDYADLFSADGEFMRPYAKGREQLAALARGGKLGPNNTVHYIMNHVIEPSPEGATGKE